MKNFAQSSQEISKILTYITACGIMEINRFDYALIAITFDQQNYKLSADSIYTTKNEKPVNLSHTDTGWCFIHHEDKSFFKQEFAINCGFYFSEKVESSNSFRYYFFSANNYNIYKEILNNLSAINKFASFFKNENSEIINCFSNIWIDFDNQKSKYFKKPNAFPDSSSEKENLVAILRSMDILDEDSGFTEKEWRLLTSYNYGKTHNIDMSHMLNISQAEMERAIDKLRAKLLTNKN